MKKIYIICAIILVILLVIFFYFIFYPNSKNNFKNNSKNYTIKEIPNFLTKGECNKIINISKNKLI